jgi:hypothetical protein
LPEKINVCSSVNLSATTQDDGTIQSYLWTLTRPQNSSSFLNIASSPTPTFKADKRDQYTITLEVTDNLGLKNQPLASKSFSPTRNADGQAIYDQTGLPGMSPVGAFGPKCRDCHKAASYDPPQTNEPFSTASDLSDSKFTAQLITERLTSPQVTHTGGKTTLSENTMPKLSSQILALRQFLDSTLLTCP